MIIGLTGTLGAGKSSLAGFLKEKGYIQYVMSDILREEAKQQGKAEDRDSLLDIGNTLRKTYGQGILVEKVIKKAQQNNDDKVIIDGIRSFGEIETLKKNGGLLIGIDSSIEIRYARNKKRGSSKDNISFEKFKEQEKKEPLQECIQKADYVIFCDGNLDDLRKEMEKMIQELQL